MKSLGWVIINRETKERVEGQIFDTKKEAQEKVATHTSSRIIAVEVFY